MYNCHPRKYSRNYYPGDSKSLISISCFIKKEAKVYRKFFLIICFNCYGEVLNIVNLGQKYNTIVSALAG